MQLIVNDTYTAPSISFPFRSITICKREKMENLLYTRNDDFMIVTATDLCKSILISIMIIFTIYFFLILFLFALIIPLSHTDA